MTEEFFLKFLELDPLCLSALHLTNEDIRRLAEVTFDLIGKTYKIKDINHD